MKRYYHQLVYALEFFFLNTAKLMLVFMVLLVSYSVFMRYVLNTGIPWCEEIPLVVVVWFTFVTLPLGVKLGLHINLDILPRNMPQWFNELLNRIYFLIVFIVGAVFLRYGYVLVAFTMRSILPASQLPSAVLYAPLPISGFFLMHEGAMGFLGLEKWEGI